MYNTTNYSGGPLVYYDKSTDENYLIGDTKTSLGSAQHCTVGDDVQPGQMAISDQKPSRAHLLVPLAPPDTAK